MKTYNIPFMITGFVPNVDANSPEEARAIVEKKNTIADYAMKWGELQVFDAEEVTEPLLPEIQSAEF